MSDDTTRQLHDQLYALGTIDPSPGLADAALREAKTRRRRGMAAVAAAAAVVLAIAIAVPLTVRHNSSGPTAPPTQRNVVVSYNVLSRSHPDGLLMVLDPRTGKYVESGLSKLKTGQVPFSIADVVVSPDGQYYASSDGRYVCSRSDVIAGKVAGCRKLDPGQSNDQTVAWSADSSRLLIPVERVNLHLTLTDFRIYDVRTNKLGKLVHLSTDDVSELIWAANDTQILGLNGQSKSRQKLEYFDLDGKLQRSVTLPKHVDGSTMFSPDGRYMALDKSLFDLQSGKVYPLQLPPGKRAVLLPVPLGWLDDDHYAVEVDYKSGNSDVQRLLVLSKSGKLIRSSTPPYGRSTLPNTGEKSINVLFYLGYGAGYPPHSGLRL